MTDTVNGFTFSFLGDLVSTPKEMDMVMLLDTRDRLIAQHEYIRAARISHLIQVELRSQGN